MCGILGGAGGEKPFSNEQISEKLALLFHRGPDEEGLWKESNTYLGIRRLAILDVANGQQPNFSEDETIVSVFNGEIYNYKSLFELLTAKGHRFRSNSDSEVIPHLYEEFGPEFAKQLDGMFAIALWDKRSDTLFLYRDNMGEKPLWYSLKNGAIDC
jgi:asparagine synthase (glutamine-hydrolysing)